MPLVAFLRGVNVGGYKTFRPSVLAKDLKLDVVNIGAAGTFVIRKPISRTALRATLARRMPFDAEVMICEGSDVLRLALADPFAGQPSGPDILQFISVMAKRKPSLPAIPLVVPPAGRWSLKVLGIRGPFVVGVCRREMKAIGHLGQLEKIVGVPLTTRSWSTILRIARTLETRGYNRIGG